MNKPKSQWQNSRQVVERIFIRGELILTTPAHFGNGDAEGLTDMPLLYDPTDGETPLLTGASIAGALRNYLREYERGYGWKDKPKDSAKSFSEKLFGHLTDVDPNDAGKEKKATVESWLLIDDALGKRQEKGSAVEFRDGVAINPATRTVEEDEHGGHKYDFEALIAGTTFDLGFEFWRTEKDELLPALLRALQGFEAGEIGLGLRKRRGLGECRVSNWQVWRYNMSTDEGLLGWLNHDSSSTIAAKSKLSDWFQETPLTNDRRQKFTLEASFALQGSLLIRSGTGSGNSPDMVHLRSWRNGEEKPVLSGTSLAGALRGRALRIAKTMLEKTVAETLVNDMFGKRIKSADDEPTGSRLVVKEKEVDGIPDLVQNRVKIDRFTGGSYPQALFSQQPIWSKGNEVPAVTINLELRQPFLPDDDDEKKKKAQAKFEAQVGLLLLVLKDLWTSDLPLGGESSVGRGRLQGLWATMKYADNTWTIRKQPDGKLEIQGKDDLENFVASFHAWRGDEAERRA